MRLTPKRKLIIHPLKEVYVCKYKKILFSFSDYSPVHRLFFFSKEVTDVNTCSIYVEFIREGRTHFNDSTEVVSCYVLFLPKTLNANNKCLDNVLVFHMFVVGKLYKKGETTEKRKKVKKLKTKQNKTNKAPPPRKIFFKGEGDFKKITVLSSRIASKHSAFPLTEVSASEVPAILKKFVSKEADVMPSDSKLVGKTKAYSGLGILHKASICFFLVLFCCFFVVVVVFFCFSKQSSASLS